MLAPVPQGPFSILPAIDTPTVKPLARPVPSPARSTQNENKKSRSSSPHSSSSSFDLKTVGSAPFHSYSSTFSPIAGGFNTSVLLPPVPSSPSTLITAASANGTNINSLDFLDIRAVKQQLKNNNKRHSTITPLLASPPTLPRVNSPPISPTPFVSLLYPEPAEVMLSCLVTTIGPLSASRVAAIQAEFPEAYECFYSLAASNETFQLEINSDRHLRPRTEEETAATKKQNSAYVLFSVMTIENLIAIRSYNNKTSSIGRTLGVSKLCCFVLLLFVPCSPLSFAFCTN